jgi:hypothetical protein
MNLLIKLLYIRFCYPLYSKQLDHYKLTLYTFLFY